VSQVSHHKLVIRTIGEVGTERIQFRVGYISSKCEVSRSTVYKTLWILQLIGAVRHHGSGQWSLVRRRWRRSADAVITDYEWAIKAAPKTLFLLEQGLITEARASFRKE
jgi:hypothetical protein